MTETKNNGMKEIEIWKKKLLDLGKHNNLINFKDTKSQTLEVLSPSFSDAYKKILSSSSIQIFDDKLDTDSLIHDDNIIKTYKEEYLAKYVKKVSPSQFLVFNEFEKSRRIIKNLMKKSSDSLTERGVNILYIAFGFIYWKDIDNSSIEYKAPVLMVPITITNESVNEPYYIHPYESEIALNTSLQYMLETQYGIMVSNYDDQDIDEYLSEIENKTSNLGWRVEKEIRISTFSFNKLGMYLDIDANADRIANNSNVLALTNAEVKDNIFVSKEELSKIENSRDLFIKQMNVVDADFSQTEAIEYAKLGKSFVLQGPPGTGKSQTITNIISELIFSGKKVLFVSEKMAALDVVYNNLKKAKLSDYCLGLHSYKANKKDFIGDLYSTLTKHKTLVSTDVLDNVHSLLETTNKLNEYNDELYENYEPVKLSLRSLIAYANHYSSSIEIPFIIQNISKLSSDDLNKNCNLLSRYANYEKTIGYDYKSHILYGLKLNDSSYSFKLKFADLLVNLTNSTNTFVNTLGALDEKYGVKLENKKEVNRFIEFIDFCQDNYIKTLDIFSKGQIESYIFEANELKKISLSLLPLMDRISKKYDLAIYAQDYKSMYDDFTKKGSSPISRMFNSRFKESNNKLVSFRLDKKKVQYQEAIDDLQSLIKIEEYKQKFEKYSINIKSTGFKIYDEYNTDFDKLSEVLDKLKSYLLSKKFNSGCKISDIKIENHNRKLYSSFKKEYANLGTYEEELGQYIDKDIIDTSSMSYEDKQKYYTKISSNQNDIDIYVEFYGLYKELKSRNLIPFIDLVIDGGYELKEMEDSYKLCFYRQWVDYIFKNNQKLYTYNRFLHESDVNQFIEDDKTQLEISKAYLNAKLSSSRPDPMLQISGSPASVIMHEHEKKRKIKPIRTLMKEIPEFIQEIKPCFLMSPLSVSTYLPDNMQFDVTIFDEASQVFPEDAIVAIYRSKQLIVVGDSKQMPPTKFFMTLDNDDDDYDEESSDIDSYESILDLCSTTFPTKSLLCHYRSRDESLINFSNKNFYNYNLVTYPSIYEKKEDFGVDFEYIEDGVFDSKTKSNIKEAQRIVDLVFEHFSKYPSRSLGVVAFNIGQQDLILRMIDKKRMENPSFEQYFKPENEEPFFVKNLETVQGDERDTIIFSITYGRNDKGQFALRFGPLNNVGGERRLNVAITRAKLNVKVVSSIKAIDIDVSRVSNEGPKLLRDYLEYAEKGKEAFTRVASENSESELDTPFENDIYKFLKDNGYDVSTNVGCSKYRIDIGLKKPGTDNYVLAIECDGHSYHSSKSTRDRDRLRKTILERMGWKYYRIWSTDWYRNNEYEKRSLIEACNNALNDDGDDSNESKPQDSVIDISDMVKSKKVEGSTKLFDKYVSFKGRLIHDVSRLAEKFVEVEGPVSIDYFLKRICSIWGYDKVTSAIKQEFENKFNSSIVTIEGGFLYGPNQKNYSMRKDLGLYYDDIDNISQYEIRNGMYEAIKQNRKCKKEELFSFIRSQLGYSRAGDKINRKLERSFMMLSPYVLIDEEQNISIDKNQELKIIKREQ